ncbi:unnamed protein product [Orchesella dallaii]|uniref:RING-type domain-containing protein n=1 Tax=Orchesella dallaii TaxID=48710 RepID=A0ABP1QGK1_9HEXA
MECSICWGLLNESASESSLSPATKKCKMSNSPKTGSASTSDLCCTPCGHIYHRKCLEGWLNANANCPKCRHPITQKALYPVFLDADGNEPEKRSASQNPNLAGGNKGFHFHYSSFRKAPNEVCTCTREQCQDLHQRHVLLTQDYEEMEERYRQEKERADVIAAKLQSLQQNNSNNDESRSDSGAAEGVDDEYDHQGETDDDDFDDSSSDW